MKTRVLGFEVTVQPSFFLMAAMLGFPRRAGSAALVQGLSWIVAVLVSVLVHELGHALAIRRFGGQARIELYAMGGLTYPQYAKPPAAAQSMMVSFAGPLAGFLLGGAIYAANQLALIPPHPHAARFVDYMLWTNLSWGVLNLLPMLPLDGGNILRAMLGVLMPGRGERTASLVSIAVAVGAVAIALLLRWTWAAMIAGWAGVTTYQALRRSDASARDVRHWEDLRELKEQWSEYAYDEQCRRLEELVRVAKSPELVSTAADMLAATHVAHGDGDAAAAALAHRARESAPPSAALRGAIVALQGNPRDAIAILEPVAASDPQAHAFWMLGVEALAKAHIDLGHPGRAIELVSELRERAPSRRLPSYVAEKLFYAGELEAAAKLAAVSFERFGEADDAYNVACSYARMPDRNEEALTWLSRAIEVGYRDGAQLDSDADLQSIKDSPRYHELRAKLAP